MKKNHQRLWRRSAATAGVAALSVAAAGLFVTPAQAAPESIDDASFSWRINDESGGGAFFGGCNFLVAGAAGDAGGSRLWSEADGFYKTAEGDVSITKPNSADEQVQPTWSTKCQNAAGGSVNTQAGSTTGNQVNFENGVGTVDVEAGTAELAWDGTFTIVYYGGMTYWSISNPELTVNADGTGQLTGTASGYGADMYDPSMWVTLPETEIELATFSGVEITAAGDVTITPDYAGVEIEVEAGGPSGEQNRTRDGWGSFPQSWVDFNVLTGQAAYWYTSGGSVDPKKTAANIELDYTAAVEEEEPPVDNEIPVAGEDDVAVGVEIEEDGGTDPTDPEEPGEPEPGIFKWELASNNASLGKASVNDAGGFSATGSLPNVTVTDTRAESAGWELNGKAGEFISTQNTFAASALGWTPSVTGGEGTVNPGAAVTAGESGLAQSHNLATATDASSAIVNASLNLLAPASTPAGDYTSLLTITAVQK
ncbi:MAG: HtaA domain-containing protein [Micrococcaceae bacterium]